MNVARTRTNVWLACTVHGYQDQTEFELDYIKLTLPRDRVTTRSLGLAPVPAADLYHTLLLPKDYGLCAVDVRCA